MARPFKDPSDRKSVDLRIPVTDTLKSLVTQAAKASGVDMAASAHPILEGQAKSQLANLKLHRPTKKQRGAGESNPSE